MLITKIEVQKNNEERFNVYVDGEFCFSLAYSTIIKEKLKEGQSISTSDINRYKTASENEKAYMYLLYYLQYGDRTEKEIRMRLKMKGYQPSAIAYAVDRAIEVHLIDDNRLCDQYVYEKLNSSKPDGPQKIKSKLISRGINIDIIEEAIEKHLCNESEQSKILLLVQKKAPVIKAKNSYDMRGKLFRFLAQKGFNFDDINSVLDGVFSDDEFLASFQSEESE